MVDAGEGRASTPMGRGSTYAEPEAVVHDIVRRISLGPSRRPRLGRAAGITAGALALGVAAAGCGGPSTTGAVTAPTAAAGHAGGGRRATGLVAYTACMRAHGVTSFSAHPTSSVGITYCQRRVPVELHIYTGLDHRQAAVPFLTQAQAFLAQRFENLPFQDGCAGIGPGNPIVPVPVPRP